MAAANSAPLVTAATPVAADTPLKAGINAAAPRPPVNTVTTIATAATTPIIAALPASLSVTFLYALFCIKDADTFNN